MPVWNIGSILANILQPHLVILYPEADQNSGIVSTSFSLNIFFTSREDLLDWYDHKIQ